MREIKNIVHIASAIYEKLADDTSKYLFEKRVMYWLTKDYRYINDMIESLPIKKEMDQIIENCKGISERLIVYGAGNDYELLKRAYPTFDFYCFCDRNADKQKNGWRGKKVISPKELIISYKDYPVMINTTGFHKEIHQFLTENGFDEAQIINLGKLTGTLYDRQYFDSDIMSPVEEECFVDGGAYDGSTSRMFADWCDNRQKKIYAFEPDKYNYIRLQKSFEAEPVAGIEFVNKGLWKDKDVLCFSMNGDQGSRIVEDENANVLTIETESIDNVVGDEKITFIKMDVEGAELEALEGAKETILKHHPRLAICIYHKPEDILVIPEYILSLSKEYRFYVRHYQVSENETVLYAV